MTWGVREPLVLRPGGYYVPGARTKVGRDASHECDRAPVQVSGVDTLVGESALIGTRTGEVYLEGWTMGSTERRA